MVPSGLRHRPQPSPLEHGHDHAVGRADREQVHDGGLDRNGDRPEDDHQQEEGNRMTPPMTQISRREKGWRRRCPPAVTPPTSTRARVPSTTLGTSLRISGRASRSPGPGVTIEEWPRSPRCRHRCSGRGGTTAATSGDDWMAFASSVDEARITPAGQVDGHDEGPVGAGAEAFGEQVVRMACRTGRGIVAAVAEDSHREHRQCQHERGRSAPSGRPPGAVGPLGSSGTTLVGAASTPDGSRHTEPSIGDRRNPASPGAA